MSATCIQLSVSEIYTFCFNFISMKYIILLIAFFLSAQVMGQPYLNETSQWKQYFRHTAFPPGLVFVEDVVIQLDGDTIVGATTYHRVLKTGFATTYYIQSGDTTYHGPIHEYMDPIREVDQYMYTYDRQAGHEYLLYDFSAEVGDTLKSGYCKRDTVIRIDTIYLGDRPRKRFHLPAGAHGEICTLIEGIGPNFGLYWQPCNEVPDPQIYLQCFSQDGNFIQLDSTFDCSGLILADEVIKADALSIHPNSFTDEIEIDFPDAFNQSASISIVNLMGVVVFERELLSANSIERIALPDLPVGIYIVCIRHPQGIMSRKMMRL